MIIKFIRLIPDNTKIDFFGHRFYAFVTSLIIIGGSLLCIAIQGLNFGIDFTGGTIIEVRISQPFQLSEIREDLNNLELGEVSIQEFGAPTDLLIRLPQQEGDADVQKMAIAKVQETLNAEFEEGAVDYRRTEYVGPQVGEELKIAALLAVLVAILGITAYIWTRFDWQYCIGGMLALLHDVIGITGFFALTQMHFDLSTVAAILLVAGYSINETIIIFDRVRETLRKFKKMPMPQVINYSINSTLPRTLITSGSTLLAILALYLFGGEVIRSFVSALFLGILIGTHSSYFVSSQALYYLGVRKPKLKPSEEPVI